MCGRGPVLYMEMVAFYYNQLDLSAQIITSNYRHTLFYCISLYGSLQIMCFYKLKVSSNPLLSKYISTVFPTAFTRLVSLDHILVIPIIF